MSCSLPRPQLYQQYNGVESTDDILKQAALSFLGSLKLVQKDKHKRAGTQQESELSASCCMPMGNFGRTLLIPAHLLQKSIHTLGQSLLLSCHSAQT